MMKNMLMPIDLDLHKKLKALCALKGTTMGKYVTDLILKALKKEEKVTKVASHPHNNFDLDED